MSARLLISLLTLLAWPLAHAGTDSHNDDAIFPYHVKMFDVPAAMEGDIGDYRRRWKRLTGFEYSGLHWNQFITVYTNIGDVAYQQNYLQYISWFEDPDELENTPYYTRYPKGTVLLKENFTAKAGKPSDAITVTAMIKHAPGYDPDNGDWEYLQFDVDGNVLLQGSSANAEVQKRCAGCHQHVADRDYVFSQLYSASARE